MNNFLKIIITFISISLIFILVSFNTYANDINYCYLGERIELSQSDKVKYKELFSLSIKNEDSDSYKDSFIYSFDVSENNGIVILFDNATIIIFDNNGKITRVFEFNKELLGSFMSKRGRNEAYIKWNNDSLELIFERGTSYYFTINGEILDICNFDTTTCEITNPKIIKTDECKYMLKNRIIINYLFGDQSYDSLVQIDNNGKETYIFKSASLFPKPTIFLLVIAALIILFNLTALIITIKSIRRRTG